MLLLRFLESLSHANARLSFGWLGERLLISPRFHRAHHGVLAAGQRSCNYGAILPWWDMLFGTADFSRDYVRTGDPAARRRWRPAAWAQQQRPACAGWPGGWAARIAAGAARDQCTLPSPSSGVIRPLKTLPMSWAGVAVRLRTNSVG